MSCVVVPPCSTRVIWKSPAFRVAGSLNEVKENPDKVSQGAMSPPLSGEKNARLSPYGGIGAAKSHASQLQPLASGGAVMEELLSRPKTLNPLVTINPLTVYVPCVLSSVRL